MKKKIAGTAILAVVLVALGTAAGAADDAASLTETSKALANPVSSLWSLSFQQNNYLLDMDELDKRDVYWQSNLVFQPVLPVALTENWNLITRPVIPLFVSTPYPEVATAPAPHLDMERRNGFGDVTLMELFSPSPKMAGNWLLGVGPTFILPTGSNDYTSQGKWQVGPAAIVGYLSKGGIVGALVQQWYSFADGRSGRQEVSQMNLQPFAAVFFGEGWSVGYSGNILANWNADSDNTWTVPIGLQVSKVTKIGKLPVKIGLAVQYMPIHPDVMGQVWNVQLQLTPVIPKLIQGTLF